MTDSSSSTITRLEAEVSAVVTGPAVLPELAVLPLARLWVAGSMGEGSVESHARAKSPDTPNHAAENDSLHVFTPHEGLGVTLARRAG